MKRSQRSSVATPGISESFGRRLDLYALAASAAGVSLLAMGQPAEAEIVYTPAQQNIGVNSHFNLDLNHDGITDFQIWNNYSFRNAIEAKLGVRPMLAENRIAGNSEYAAALSRGVTIGGNKHFPQKGDGIMIWWFYSFSSTVCCGSYGPWRDVENRYLGLKFSVNGETHYGWARLSASIRGSNIRAILTGYAYETEANKAIGAGQTTEVAASGGVPAFGLRAQRKRRDRQVGALGLLALGAVGPSIWRREETSAL